MSGFSGDLEREWGPSVVDVGHAITLPPYVYTSSEFFEFEKEAVFSHDWLCLGRHEEIPEPGDYFTIQVNDEPLVVVRGSDRRIRVLSNVCRHRATLVNSGSGNCGRSFQCHYHWWRYDLEGRLVAAPEIARPRTSSSRRSASRSSQWSSGTASSSRTSTTTRSRWLRAWRDSTR